MAIGFTVTGDYEFLGNVLHGINVFFRGNGWYDNGNCVYHGNGLRGNYRSFTAVKIPRGNPRGKP